MKIFKCRLLWIEEEASLKKEPITTTAEMKTTVERGSYGWNILKRCAPNIYLGQTEKCRQCYLGMASSLLRLWSKKTFPVVSNDFLPEIIRWSLFGKIMLIMGVSWSIKIFQFQLTREASILKQNLMLSLWYQKTIFHLHTYTRKVLYVAPCRTWVGLKWT